MKMNISRFTKFAALTMLTLVCVVAEAAPWRSLGPRNQLQTLVITGNYKSPRLLAELIQNESRQPYMLLPDPVRGDGRIYFCPPKSAALEVKEEYFNAFIRTAGPKRIVILGDERYVPRRYEDMLDKAIPIVRVSGSNWFRVAQELTFLLNLSHLDRNYRELRTEMIEDGGIVRPVSRPAKPKAVENSAEVKAEEAKPETVPAAGEEPAEVK
jgi:hypothetical protein